jgi:uncharacterized protein YqgV (UPF0045/DUF77 family)
MPAKGGQMIAEIQVLPSPAGTDEKRFAHVDAAIEVIVASGLAYEVGALGTTVEGPPDEVWPLLQAVHEACLAAGASSAVTIIKVADGAGESGLSVSDLTSPWR